MKGSDFVEMTINIGGEPIKLKVKFDDQNEVRDAEHEVKLYIDKLKKSWLEASDRELLAMTAFQFAKWYLRLSNIQKTAIELVNQKCSLIDNNTSESFPEVVIGDSQL